MRSCSASLAARSTWPGPSVASAPRYLDVAVVQLASVPGDLAGNMDRLTRAVREHGRGADLIVTPELAVTGYDIALLAKSGPDLAEPTDGPAVIRAQELAAETGATIVLGLLERDGDALYDSAAIVPPNGMPPVVYRKTHPYPQETGFLRPGDTLLTADIGGARIGPLICFEHAFPDIATALALADAQVLVIPSAVPLGFEYLLELRTRARAQDNQIFAIGCNMAGGSFCGRSIVADPRGDVLAQMGGGPDGLRCRLDLSAIARERRQEPSLRERRPELYADLPTKTAHARA